MLHDNIDNIFNKCKKDTNTDEEIITINKYKLTYYISTLMGVVFIFGISIGSTITLLTSLLVKFSQ